MNGDDYNKIERIVGSVVSRTVVALETKQQSIIEKLDELKQDVDKSFNRADKAYILSVGNKTEIENLKRNEMAARTVWGLIIAGASALISFFTSVFNRG